MSALDDKYELSDKVRKVITKSIMDKTEEEYAAWLENEGEVILAGKEKKEPEHKSAEEALKEATANQDFVPNTPKLETEKTPLKATVTKKGDKTIISL
jgi:hypothetical protein